MLREECSVLSMGIRRMRPREKQGSKIVENAELPAEVSLAGTEGREYARAALGLALVMAITRPAEQLADPAGDVAVGAGQFATRDRNFLAALQRCREVYAARLFAANGGDQAQGSQPRQRFDEPGHEAPDPRELLGQERIDVEVERLGTGAQRGRYRLSAPC